MTDETPLPPPPPPPGSGDDRTTPWYRIPVSRDPDGVIGGVVAGIARAYGFDVRTTRVAVVILTLVLPVLLFAYVAAWVLLPARPEEATGLEQLAHERSRLPIYIALGAVAVIVGLGSIGSWLWFGTFPWPLALIAIGVLLWAAPTFRSGRDAGPAATTSAGTSAGRTGADASPSSTSPTSSASSANSASFAPPSTPAASTGAPAVTAHGAASSSAPAARRPGIPIGGSVALLALLALTVAISGQAAGWWSVSILGVIIGGLIAIAVAGVVSALVNRRWYLLLPVVPVVFAAMILSIAQPNFDGGIGDRTRTPVAADVADGMLSERMAMGQLTIDLRRLELPATGEPIIVDARVGMGRLHVIVPDDATFELDASFGAGRLEVDGRELVDGLRQSERRTFEADAPTGRLLLDLHVGMGEIDVRVAAPRR